METKYVKVPFEVELAKKITNGEVDGRVVTRDGRIARVVCYDVIGNQYKICALVNNGKAEDPEIFTEKGLLYDNQTDDLDLMLEVPEYITFKDGDIVTLGWEENGKHCIWVSIIKSLSKYDKTETESYVSVCLSADETSVFPLLFDESQRGAMWARKSTEIEEKEIINELKASKEPKAKEYLKRFFGIEQKQECEFKPFDKVLVRECETDRWRAGLFSHMNEEGEFICIGYVCGQCIPYNEQTAHLLGTTDNWEENK